MNNKELKEKIEASIRSFDTLEFNQAAFGLLNTIGYDSQRRLPLTYPTSEGFLSVYQRDKLFNDNRAQVEDWKAIDLLFQLTGDDLNLGGQKALPIVDGEIINQSITSYLFFALELKDKTYTRTQLAAITREINKLFFIPVMLVFKHGGKISIAIIDRRPNKREPQKDVLEKVTLIKDICIQDPHRAHIDILHDLSFRQISAKNTIQYMEALHKAWQTVLDTKELNKKFYKELSNWYFWAVQECTFPIEAGSEETRNPTSVIRLITRLIFIWFIKEKGLVPEKLFEKSSVERVLKTLADDESSYYKAILQNLFFATLNQEDREKRKFLDESVFQGKNKQYGIANVYRFRNYFQKPEQALELFKNIPFLNGGLFECLDREREENETVPAGCEHKMCRVDGFSENKCNILSVPNELFFVIERQVDLNTIYGTKNKCYMVRGLINILKSYKFTIEENTPLEEEIALDPELLGLVFENLLAAYNLETQTTARKATGSFNTPREIVNYMVDESLILYFEQKLIGFNPHPKINALAPSQPNLSGEHQPGLQGQSERENHKLPYERRLRNIFAYNEQPNPFDRNETEILIKAIDHIKVLDPACGSGAFPMGILHRLVFILSKLDKHNQRWKQRQLEKTYEIEDPRARETAVKAIEDAFETNELNYGRKLYLIQNCIYGVDIQTIAVQIAKLRFFISLVVDQKIDDNKPNRGIASLPNLESKFVAANALLGLDKPATEKVYQPLLRDDTVEKIKTELAYLREHYFNAHTREQKLRLRNTNKRLRRTLSTELQRANWPSSSADLLADWDPYEQNASADFFDPEWMFGVSGGFDVVIGNPPYLESRHPAFIDELKNSYQTAAKNRWQEDAKYITRGSDLLIYFFENSIFNIKQDGCVVFLTQNSWLDTEYGKRFQNFLLKNTQVRKVVDSDFRYFASGEGPNINTVITIFVGKKSESKNVVSFIRYHENFQRMSIASLTLTDYEDKQYAEVHKYPYTDAVLRDLKWGILLASSDEIMCLLEILNQKAIRLEKVKGLKLSVGQGLNLSKNKMVDTTAFSQFSFAKKASIPFFTSEDGASFVVISTKQYILDKTRLSKNEIQELNSHGIQVFDSNSTRKVPPKLIMPRGVSRHFCALNSVNCFSSSCVDIYDLNGNADQSTILNLWLFFNSSAGWLLREICGRKNLGGGMLKAEAVDLKSLPIYMDFNKPLEIKNIVRDLTTRKALVTIKEIDTNEHKNIDQIVFDYLQVPNDDRITIINTLKTKILGREKKART